MSTKFLVKDVSSSKDLKQFIRFPELLYSDHPFFIVPLRKKEYKTLSREHNPAFEFCDAKYWIVFEDEKIVGRVAAIINHRYNEEHDTKYVRFGWIDFIENQEVVDLLFSTVEQWALQNDAEVVHGPLGFSSFDPSGILIDGYDEMPTSFARYNYPYYAPMIEQAGYAKEMDWIEYLVSVPRDVPAAMIRGAELLKKRYKLSAAEIKNGKDLERYADEIFELLNKEYQGLYAFSKLTAQQVEALKAEFLPMIKPGFISVVVDADDKVVAFGITMPSLAKALQKVNGKLLPFGIYHIWKAMNRNNLADTLLIAVASEYHGKGVHSIIFGEIIPALVKFGVSHIESTRHMEENSKVTNLWGRFEHRQHKRTRSYIKQL